jgi:hypothetical protein
LTSETQAPAAEPTPEQLLALTAELAALRSKIEAAYAAAPRSATQMRLSTASECLSEARREITGAVEDLRRVSAVPADACRWAWGVCPEHGDTLTASGGRTWCRVRNCPHQWEYDYLDTPCPEPTAYTISDAAGSEPKRVCYGHALGARRIPGITYDPPLPAGAVENANLLESLMKLTEGR